MPRYIVVLGGSSEQSPNVAGVHIGAVLFESTEILDLTASSPHQIQEHSGLIVLQESSKPPNSALSSSNFYTEHSYACGDVVVERSSDMYSLAICAKTTSPLRKRFKLGHCTTGILCGKVYTSKNSIVESLQSCIESGLKPYVLDIIKDSEEYSESPDDEPIMTMDDGEPFYERCYQLIDELKSIGNASLKSGHLNLAVLKYLKALKYLFNGIPDKELSEKYNLKFTETRYSLALNLALAYTKLSSALTPELTTGTDAAYLLQKAVESASVCLDDSNALDISTRAPDQTKAKALYRRASSFLLLKQEDKAILDLEAALQLVPSDVAIKKELLKAKAIHSKRIQSQKSTYSKFFS